MAAASTRRPQTAATLVATTSICNRLAYRSTDVDHPFHLVLSSPLCLGSVLVIVSRF